MGKPTKNKGSKLIKGGLQSNSHELEGSRQEGHNEHVCPGLWGAVIWEFLEMLRGCRTCKSHAESSCFVASALRRSLESNAVACISKPKVKSLEVLKSFSRISKPAVSSTCPVWRWLRCTLHSQNVRPEKRRALAIHRELIAGPWTATNAILSSREWDLSHTADTANAAEHQIERNKRKQIPPKSPHCHKTPSKHHSHILQGHFWFS